MPHLIERAGHSARVLTTALLSRCTFDPEATSYDIACSGGVDSTALAILAVATGKPVILHHVDHGLRPSSTAEAQAVETFGAELGCVVKIYEVDIVPGPNLEARAREARFGALPDGIITGHHMDDQAETVLLNLLRGSGNRGLGAMRPGPSKPLLGLRKYELEGLCQAYEVAVAYDETNDDESLRRNAVRKSLLPVMERVGDRDPVPVLARVARHARSDDDALEELSLALIENPYSGAQLKAVPEALRRRALRRLIREHEARILAPSEAEIERIEAVVMGVVVAAQIEGNLEIRRSKGILSIQAIDGHYASDDAN